MVEGDGFLAVAAREVRVYRPALDGTGADKGDLHDEVEKHPGFQPRQGGHLRAGLHLEHAHRVGTAEHVVDLRLGQVQLPQVDRAPGGLFHQIDHVVQRLEHAQAQQVELHQPGGRAVIFVPLEHAAAFHARPLHGHHVRDGPIAQHHAAGMDP